MRPMLLDLYCCAGGAAMGYHRAGFDVVGVDIVDRPNYPFTFLMRDALDVLGELLDTRRRVTWMNANGDLVSVRPDAIHSSCPCQHGNPLTRGTNASRGWGRGGGHQQLVPATRELLDAIGLPYVIEQPVGHGGLIRNDLVLCTKMLYPVDFPAPWVQRHRCFELSGFAVPQPSHAPWHGHRGYVRGLRHGVWREGPYVAAYGDGGGKATVAEMQHALGIDWTDVREELTEALHPNMTTLIGEAFLSRPGSVRDSGPLGVDCGQTRADVPELIKEAA